MFLILKKYRVFFILYFLIGFPVPVKKNKSSKFRLAYTGVLLLTTSCSSLWTLIHLRDLTWGAPDAAKSSFLSGIDYFELILQCLISLFLPAISILQFQRSVEMLEKFERFKPLVPASVLFNVMLGAYLILFCGLVYLTYMSLIVSFVYLAVVAFVFSSIFQLLMTKQILELYERAVHKSSAHKVISFIGKIYNLSSATKKYFGPLQLLEYVFIGLSHTLFVYFLLYRVTDLSAIIFVLYYAPYLVTFFAWSMCANVTNEVSN